MAHVNYSFTKTNETNSDLGINATRQSAVVADSRGDFMLLTGIICTSINFTDVAPMHRTQSSMHRVNLEILFKVIGISCSVIISTGTQ